MKRAFVGVREQPHYRRDAFVSGLKALGYEVDLNPPKNPDKDTVYVCWNRYLACHDIAMQVELSGGTVLVAENGFIGPNGISPVHMEPRSIYAIARRYHNDAEMVPKGAPERWNALGVDLRPWRARGNHILVCANRTFGTPGRIMPMSWAAEVKDQLQALTKREVRVRTHPGNNKPEKPLAADLRDAHATVIWYSSAGLQSLLAGVPVFQCAPNWIGADAACRDLTQIENPPLPDRGCAFAKVAATQWTIDEISSGFAFDHLLRRTA